ncbi:hypothetical protein BDN72DRAFT_905248 [Pluteus cervinus]|uniref:Uncharacterized protein n=1 Tax=Pluteus cervinus TaxID=181527 RepID=A0ACD3A357_9AGAR|nr:hypothetical protein BDN72DRAFT_905248 [Pluteus cervinus]
MATALFLPPTTPTTFDIDSIINSLPLVPLPVLSTQHTTPEVSTQTPTATAVAPAVKPHIAEAVKFLLRPLSVAFAEKMDAIKLLLNVTLETLFYATTDGIASSDTPQQSKTAKLTQTAQPSLTLTCISTSRPPPALQSVLQTTRIDWTTWMEGLCSGSDMTSVAHPQGQEGFDLVIAEDEVVVKPLKSKGGGTDGSVIWRRDTGHHQLGMLNELAGPGGMQMPLVFDHLVELPTQRWDDDDDVILVERTPCLHLRPSWPAPEETYVQNRSPWPALDDTDYDVLSLLNNIREVDIPFDRRPPPKSTPYNVLSEPFKVDGLFSSQFTLQSSAAKQTKSERNFVSHIPKEPWLPTHTTPPKSFSALSSWRAHKRTLSNDSDQSTTDSAGSLTTSPSTSTLSSPPSSIFSSPYEKWCDTPATTPSSSIRASPSPLPPFQEEWWTEVGPVTHEVQEEGWTKVTTKKQSNGSRVSTSAKPKKARNMRPAIKNEPPRITALKEEAKSKKNKENDNNPNFERGTLRKRKPSTLAHTPSTSITPTSPAIRASSETGKAASSLYPLAAPARDTSLADISNSCLSSATIDINTLLQDQAALYESHEDRLKEVLAAINQCEGDKVPSIFPDSECEPSPEIVLSYHVQAIRSNGEIFDQYEMFGYDHPELEEDDAEYWDELANKHRGLPTAECATLHKYAGGTSRVLSGRVAVSPPKKDDVTTVASQVE